MGLENTFFSAALKKASALIGKPGRIVFVLSRLAVKLKEINWSNVSRRDIKEKLLVLARMVKAFAVGDYRDVPPKTMVLLLAAILYFVNPIDLIPDFIPASGLIDDFAILLWIFRTVDNEVQKFLTWEKTQLQQ